MVEVGHQARGDDGRTGADDVGQQSCEKDLTRSGNVPQRGPHEVTQPRVGNNPLAIEAAVGVANRLQTWAARRQRLKRLKSVAGLTQINRRRIKIAVARVSKR